MLAILPLATLLPLLVTATATDNTKVFTVMDTTKAADDGEAGTWFLVGENTSVSISGETHARAPGDAQQQVFLGSDTLDNLEVTIAAFGGATVGTCKLSGTPTGTASFTSDSGGCYAHAEADGTLTSEGITMVCDPKPEGFPCAA